MSIKRTEIIDAYLRNELDSEELQAFEGQLAGDPTLREELDFQQQVIKGLGEFRKSELKSRLTAINVSVPWWEVGQLVSPGLMKLTGAIVTATFIGTGIYYFNATSDEVPEVQPTVFESDLSSVVASTTPVFEESSKDIPQVVLSSEEEEVKPLALDEASSPEVADAEVSEVKVSPLVSDEDESLQSGEFLPEVDIPNPGIGQEESQFTSESAKIPLASNADIISSADEIDIKTSQRSSEEIRYKYYDGKLHLYGNFKKNPYEIIEINSPRSKMVYLYHNNRYFKLLTTDKVVALPQITDQVLIQELEIVRVNKTE